VTVIGELCEDVSGQLEGQAALRERAQNAADLGRVVLHAHLGHVLGHGRVV